MKIIFPLLVSRLLCFPCFQHRLLCGRLSTSGNWDQSQGRQCLATGAPANARNSGTAQKNSISAEHAYERSALGYQPEKVPANFISTCQACIASRRRLPQKRRTSPTLRARAPAPHSRRDTENSRGCGSSRDKPSCGALAPPISSASVRPDWT